MLLARLVPSSAKKVEAGFEIKVEAASLRAFTKGSVKRLKRAQLAAAPCGCPFIFSYTLVSRSLTMTDTEALEIKNDARRST
jgi:hypothetical protein